MKEEKNMKKRTISLMLVGAMVATMFAGCGNSEVNTNASSTEAGKTRWCRGWKRIYFVLYN